MGTCPNCGSYISPGTTVCSCGTTFSGSYSYENEKKDEPVEVDPRMEKCDEYVRQAKKHMKEKNYLKAIECYDKAIDGFPGYYSKRIKADAYFNAGMYDEALECYRKRLSSLENHIDDFVVLCDIGRTLDRLNRFDEAMDAYNKAFDIIEKNYERSVEISKREVWMGYEAIERGCESALEDKQTWSSWVYRYIAYSYLLRADYFALDYKVSRKHLNTAIGYIEDAIQLDYDNANNWNVKAIILERLGEYEKSKKFYDISLEFERNDIVAENKASMLKDWAFELSSEGKFRKAIDLLEEAIEVLPKSNSNENKRYYESLIINMMDRMEFKKQYDMLKGIGKENLITITGTQFYDGPNLEEGMMLQLVREPDNEFDPDAIAVFADGEKVGYVANRDATCLDISSKASEIQDIPDNAYAEYLINYMSQYHIARIIDKYNDFQIIDYD